MQLFSLLWINFCVAVEMMGLQMMNLEDPGVDRA